MVFVGIMVQSKLVFTVLGARYIRIRTNGTDNLWR